jgi:predicted O-methyltransferase YrrM
MDFIDDSVVEYVEKYTQEEPLLLQKINRETYAKILTPRMLAGHLQGRVLSMLSSMIKPASILEIGTYTGYSAICLAEGLRYGGVLHTIDINEELEEMVRDYFKEAGIEELVKYYIGNAVDIIPVIEGNFDLVFIDADKENYANYFDQVINRVTKGGFIIADNVLWSGKVLDDPLNMDEDTRALLEFSQKVQVDNRVENVLFPIRDGLMVMRKL